jgi:twinkle protein
MVIRTAVQEGTKDVFIDPITCFTDGLIDEGGYGKQRLMNAGDIDSFLKYMVRELDNMAKDLDFTYYVFCHLNAPPKGSKPHEEGGAVKSNQFTGSRVMMRACTYMIGQERDKKNEDEVVRNTTIFKLLEDRMFGNYAKFPVFYDRDTGSYLEPKPVGGGI